MLIAQLAELEQEFRKNWKGYRAQCYDSYLRQVDEASRAPLLARLLAVELEYAYQPPLVPAAALSSGDHSLDSATRVSEESRASDDDERVRPRVELLLLQFPMLKQHRELIIQLVMLEFALRLRFDSQPPTYDSYLELCPHEKQRLGDMLQMVEAKLFKTAATPASQSPVAQRDTTVTEGSSQRPLSLTQLPCNLGYFLLTNIIGQGGMGTVYAAVDLRSAAHVALKLVKRFDSWSIYRFIEEFTWLANLNHPNVVQLYDTFSEGDLRYFSMELVEGQAIREWFKTIRDEPNSWQRLRRVLSQAALAVSFLHDHEVIHRDIKSSNLMITSRDKAVLLDLGLAIRANQDHSTFKRIDGEHLVGTLPYLPPEALHRQPPTFAGDWYSFGVMIYEAISGEFPPTNYDPATLLPRTDNDRDIPQELRTGLAECPEDLRELCVALLSHDPADRPKAASIISQLGSDLGEPIPFTVSEADFRGRDEAIGFLSEGFKMAREGRANICLVRGESGLGKTTLVQQWRAHRLRSRDVLQLNIRCRNQDHTPLRVLNLLVQEMVTELSKQPVDLWLDLARGGGEEIVHTFPQMERLSDAVWPSLSPALDAVEGSARRAVGLHAFLGWLKGLSQRRHLVLVIDDAHWGDAESGRILSHLFRPHSEFQGLLVLVDQGSQVESPFLSAFMEAEPLITSFLETYELGPLRTQDCEDLLEGWKDRLKINIGAVASRDIVTRSSGSPFLLQELFRAFVNYVVRHKLTDDNWFADATKHEGVVHRRFSMLPATTEKVLQFLAVSDQALGLHQLQTASRVMPAQLLAELNHLSGQGWIRWNGKTLDSEVEISHERFRQVVLQSMTEDRLQRRHFRLARMLSSEAPPPWRRIAHHYAQARQFREAAACYMEGARAAARRLSFPEALWLLERAFHPLAQRTASEIRAAKRLQADCLSGNGSSVAAAELYHELSLSSKNQDEILELECLAGEQWIRAGQLKRGIHSLRGALMSLQVHLRITGWGEQMAVRIQSIRMAFATPPNPAQAESLPPFSQTEQALNRISGPLSFLDNPLGVRLILRMVSLAHQRGSPVDRALAMMRWAMVLSYSKRRLRQRAIHWIRAARKLIRQSEGANARALAHVSMFLCLSLQGRFYESLRSARRAERLYESHHASDTWETGFVCWVALGHLWYLGELREQCQRTLAYRLDANQRTDAMWTFWMHINAAHLTDLISDNVEEGRLSLQKAAAAIGQDSYGTPQITHWTSQIRQLLYESKPREALELMKSHWARVKATNFLKVAFYSWAVHGLRVACHLACMALEPENRAYHLKGARSAISKIAKLEEPPFLLYAQAFQLVAWEAAGEKVLASQWQQAISTAERLHLGLLKMALEWHYELARDQHCQQSTSAARQAFLDRGVINPERLMNVIVPLPVIPPPVDLP